MSENASGKVYKKEKVKNRMIGSYDAGNVYNLLGTKVGIYGDGQIWLEPAPAALQGSYKNGIIYGNYGVPAGKVGSYQDGKLYNEFGQLIGSYEGDDDGGAAGAYVLIICG